MHSRSRGKGRGRNEEEGLQGCGIREEREAGDRGRDVPKAFHGAAPNRGAVLRFA